MIVSPRNVHSTIGLLSALLTPFVFLLKLTEQILSSLAVAVVCWTSEWQRFYTEFPIQAVAVVCWTSEWQRFYTEFPIQTECFDTYCYSPLQTYLSPVVAMIPCTLEINGRCYVIFSANIVSWTRTALVLPIATCLKYNYSTTACLLVLLHDFLDHLDGTVAKVQKTMYGPVDDPILGGFVDAFCDKIVNVLSLWSILMVTDFNQMNTHQSCLYVGACSIIIAYEFILGIVRVQDYFQTYYARKYGDVELSDCTNIAAVMEGKLKEKLESLGIGCLCLAQAAGSPLETTAGIIGVTCLLLSIRLAHVSLKYKMKARRSVVKERHGKTMNNNVEMLDDCGSYSEDDSSSSDTEKIDDRARADKYVTCPKATKNANCARRPMLYSRYTFSAWPWSNERVDRVYTIGCFDLFHYGHTILFQRMKSIGKQIIVGVHDSRSIYKLKKRAPVDDTKKRMLNVKKYADIVYCVHGTDPTPYLHLIFDEIDGCTSMYVRGDDMPDFPARDMAERLMPVLFLPYTKSISSTKIRKEIYNTSMFDPNVRHDDHVRVY